MRNVILIVSIVCAASMTAQTDWDTYSDTWVAVDELGREVFSSDTKTELADPDNGIDPTVGIFYFLSHGFHSAQGTKTYDITELLNADPDNPQFGPEYENHWWGRPVLDYYYMTDPWVIAKHMQMLCDAGIDFYFFDATNAFYYADQVRAVMAEIDRRTALGMKTPKLVFTVHAAPASTATNIYKEFYANSANDKYWFMWDGKPLMLGPKDEIKAEATTTVYNRFTYRNCWAWMRGQNQKEWAWLEYYPQAPGWYLAPDGTHVTEQVSVSTAQHATTKVGKSYHDGKQPAYDKYGLCEGNTTSLGLYYEEQWKRAHELRAPVTMITQFNEWTAMRFVIKNSGEYGNIRPGGTAKVGESYFVDLYNAEFNRDIEPSTHPLIRDNYLMQTYSHVRRLKGVRPIPEPTSTKSITLDGDMAQWADVTPEFRDDIGDIKIRNHRNATYTELLTNQTGRNDIVASKVTKDSQNMYFYARTDNNLSSTVLLKSRHMWMTLLLNTDGRYSNGWAGYDYMAYFDNDARKYTLARFTGNGFEHENICEITVYKTDKELYFAIPRYLIGLQGVDCDIDFKWADNMNDEDPDVLDFYIYGDCAPNGRFNYRYKGSKVSAGIDNVASELVMTLRRIDSNTVGVSIPLSCDGKVKIECYNMQGSLVLSREYSASAGTFTSQLPLSGCGYIVKAIADNKTITKKLL